MEVLVLVLLSVLAMIGVTHLFFSFPRADFKGHGSSGIKLVIHVPHHFEDKLEGIVRDLFSEDIAGRFFTDGRVYLILPDDEPELRHIAEDLARMFPVEVLPLSGSYCIITEESRVESGL